MRKMSSIGKHKTVKSGKPKEKKTSKKPEKFQNLEEFSNILTKKENFLWKQKEFHE